MSNETIAAGGSSETTSAPSVSESKHIVSPQSREYTGIIVQTGEMLNTLANDDELNALMTAAGYDADRVADGTQLLQAAHASYLSRQGAMALQKSASLAMQHAFNNALVTYRDLRAIAATAFDTSDRIALAVQGPFPPDREAFAQNARVLYETALSNPDYVETFTANGVPQARLQAALDELDAFQTALMEYEISRADALRATTERDDAVTALREWRSRFRRRARIATRTRRDLQVKLKL